MRSNFIRQLGVLWASAGASNASRQYIDILYSSDQILNGAYRHLHTITLSGFQSQHNCLNPTSLKGSHQKNSIHTTNPSHAASTDFYQTLEVKRGATDGEIKKAYYRLAKQYHPDTNNGDPGAAKKFQDIQRAYDTLRDPQKRATYDSMGHGAYEHMESTGGAGGGGGGPGGGGGGGGMHVDPEDLFREFFGGGRGGGGGGPAAGGGPGEDFQSTIFEQMFGGAAGFGSRPSRGHTLRTTMAISFDESVKGSSKVINLNTGKQVEVSIPAGIQHGQQIRIQGHGAPGPKGTPPGDLLVQIMVMPSRQGFIRDGYDIHYEVPVSMADAALGTEVEVPTIDGHKVVAVKPGTQPQHKMRMRGYGVPMDVEGPLGRGRRGDQWIRVRVEVPRNLNDRQKQLLKEFKEAANSNSSSSGGGTAKKEEESSSSSEPKEEEKKKKKRGWFS